MGKTRDAGKSWGSRSGWMEADQIRSWMCSNKHMKKKRVIETTRVVNFHARHLAHPVFGVHLIWCSGLHGAPWICDYQVSAVTDHLVIHAEWHKMEEVVEVKKKKMRTPF